MKIESLFTRSVAEQPKKMMVKTIDGVTTKYGMMILGSESTVFQNARRQYMRHELMKTKDEIVAVEGSVDSERELATLMSCLVVSWDFEEECNDENKQKLFFECPYLCTAVEAFSMSKGNHVEQEKADS